MDILSLKILFFFFIIQKRNTGARLLSVFLVYLTTAIYFFYYFFPLAKCVFSDFKLFFVFESFFLSFYLNHRPTDEDAETLWGMLVRFVAGFFVIFLTV
jgi:hypothetical protein